MKAARLRGITAVICLVVVGAASLLGCGQPPNAGDGPTGTVKVALQTVGSDGATYQFPPGSSLNVTNIPSGSYDVGVALDGTETVLSRTLPVGNYGAWVYTAEGEQELIRTVNGKSQTVPAIWNDPQPFTFSVVQDMTTPLVLHFSVVALGDVAFETGSLRLSIDVGQTTTTVANHGQAAATLSEPRQSITTGFGLETPLGLAAGETNAASFTFDLTSAFVLTSPPRQLCANIAVNSNPSSSSSAAFEALMEQLAEGSGAAGTICIGDSGANDTITIEFSRKGAAPTGQQAFLRGTNYRFEAQLFFFVGDDILDDSTFHLSKLATPITMGPAKGSFSQGIEDLDTHQALESSLSNLDGTFQLAP